MKFRPALMAMTLHGSTGVIAVALTSSAAFGQPLSQEGDNSMEAEIIVTTQKREQRLQDVGMTITSQTGEELHSAGVTQLTQLSRVVTELNIVRSQYRFPLVSLRGVSTSVPYLSAQPTVSTYVDEALPIRPLCRVPSWT